MQRPNYTSVGVRKPYRVSCTGIMVARWLKSIMPRVRQEMGGLMLPSTAVKGMQGSPSSCCASVSLFDLFYSTTYSSLSDSWQTCFMSPCLSIIDVCCCFKVYGCPLTSLPCDTAHEFAFPLNAALLTTANEKNYLLDEERTRRTNYPPQTLAMHLKDKIRQWGGRDIHRPGAVRPASWLTCF